MSARYVEISSPLGANARENGIDLPAGAPPIRMRAEHLARLRGTNGKIDDAIAASRIVVRRVVLKPDAAEKCDEAWRKLSQPWRLASSVRDGEGVRDPDGGGLGSSTLTRRVR